VEINISFRKYKVFFEIFYLEGGSKSAPKNRDVSINVTLTKYKDYPYKIYGLPYIVLACRENGIVD